MELKQLVNECIDALQEAANRDWHPAWGSHDTLSDNVNTNDGYIDLYYYYDKKTHFWECEVVVCHDYESEENNPKYGKEDTNLQKFLEKELSECIDWSVCEEEFRYANLDEWESHGFRDEADFWHWKEGR